MRKPVFIGSATAIVTPFKENKVNYEKFEELIEFQIREGTDALVFCGSSGESATLPDEEHKSIMRFAVEKVHGRIPVIIGTGSNDTQHAIEFSKYAESVGADALLSAAPYYNKPSQEGVYRHFKKIAESVKTPIILYNVPSRTVTDIQPETVRALAEFENIAAVKECNFSHVADLINLCGEDFAVYSGEDALVLPLLSLGGKGVISVISNIAPKDMHELVTRFMKGDIAGSRKLQLKMQSLVKALFIEPSPVPVKTAMNLLGMKVGSCRLPLVDMQEANQRILKAELIRYGLLDSDT